MRLLVAALVAAFVLTAPAPSYAESAHKPRERRIQPVLSGDFPDPTITRWRGRFVSVATGSLAPRAVARQPTGPWTRVGHALTTVPDWARDDAIWAADLVEVDDGWLLYFSAPVRGLGTYGRCIGVAKAQNPLGRFRPYPAPLVCPALAGTAPASDLVNPPDAPLPSGVIDPDVQRTRDGQLLLTYRTQGVPSSIRVVPLDATGRATTATTSVPLVASTGVVENPLLVQRGASWVLITSEGYFGSCAYRTTYQVATSLDQLATAPRESLVRRRGTRLCGPGGADLVGSTLVLHAWTCPAASPACRIGTTRRRARHAAPAKRSLFAARLRWSDSGAPRVVRFLGPRERSGVIASRPDPLRQVGPGAVPTGPGEPLPVTTVLGPPGSSSRSQAGRL